VVSLGRTFLDENKCSGFSLGKLLPNETALLNDKIYYYHYDELTLESYEVKKLDIRKNNIIGPL
jgi:hypothetical protein